MIKKLLGLGIFVLGFINFSFAEDYGYFQNMSVNSNGTYKQSPYDSNVSNAVYSRGMLSSQTFGYTKRMLVFKSDDGSDQSYLFWNNNKIYFYYYDRSDHLLMQGHSNSYSICSPFNINSIAVTGCTQYEIGNGENIILNNFMNSITSSDLYGISRGYYTLYGRVYYMSVCFNSSSFDKSVCFSTSQGLSDSLGFSENLSFFNVDSNLIQDPPGWSTSGGTGNNDSGLLGNGGIELESNYSALNYYESRYGRNESICYVGTDSLSYLYGENGVSFQEGQGLSIFDVYNDLYGSGYELVWVGNWLNTWLLNYEEWFNSRGTNAEGVGHPSWLSYYNSGTHLGDLYYDNLTFPFANQPVVFYFMATYIDQNSPYSTMGFPVVSYCNIKINSGTFEEIIDQSDKNNITNYTEKSNVNIGLNSDGTNSSYTGYWVSSGVDLAFSGNVSIKNTLKNFFEEFDKALGSLDVNTNNRILPTWIVSAFIFVVLFKFLRKK